MALVICAALLGERLAHPRLESWAKERLRTELERALGRPVTIGSVRIDPSRLDFEAHDLVVSERPPGTGTVLEVPLVRGRLRAGALFRRRIDFTTLTVERPRAFLTHDAKGWDGPFPVHTEASGKSAPSTSSFRIVLRSLQIDDALVTLDERTVPFWCRAENLHLEWSGNLAGNGRARLETGSLRAGSGRTAEVGSLRAHVDVVGRRIKGAVALGLGPSTANVDGSVTLAGGPGEPAEGDLRGSFHMDQGPGSPVLQAALGWEGTPLSGTLDGRGALRFRGPVWSAQGHLDGTNISYEDLRAESLGTDVSAKPAGIELDNTVVRSFGGRISGRVRLEPRRGGQVQVIARGESLSVHEVLEAIGLVSPLAGKGSVDGTLEARIGDPGALRVQAAIRVAGALVPAKALSPTGSSGVPGGEAPRRAVSGEGQVEIRGRALVFTASQVACGATNASLRVEKLLGSPDTRLGLEARSSDLGDTSALLDAFLVDQGERGALPWESARLTGTGTIGADVLFHKNQPLVGTANYALRDAAYDGIGAAAVYGSGSADARAFTFNVTRAEKPGGSAVLEGTFPLHQQGPALVSGQFTSWPAEDILAHVSAPNGAFTRLTGPAHYRPAYGSEPASADAELDLGETRIGDTDLGSGHMTLAMRGSQIDITRLTLSGPRADLTATLRYDLDSSQLTTTVHGERVDAGLARPWLGGLTAGGHAVVDFSMNSAVADPEWEAHLRPDPDFTFADQHLPELKIDATGTREEARLEGTYGDLVEGSGQIALEAPHESLGRVALNNVLATSLLDAFRPDLSGDIGGEISGEIVWTGPLDDLSKIEAHAVLDPVRLAVGTASFESTSPVKVSLIGGAAHFDDVVLTSGEAKVHVKGMYPVREGLPVDLTFDGEIDMGALNAFVPSVTASGILKGTLHATGSPKAPDLSGSLETSGARMRLVDFPLIADRIQMKAHVDSEGITTDSLTAVLGGGDFRGTGHVGIEGLAPVSYRVQGRITDVRLAFPEGWRAEYTGRVSFEQAKGQTPVLEGDLDVVRGVWEKDFALDRFSFGGRVRAPIVRLPPPAGSVLATSVDIRLHGDDNIRCHNDLADVEGTASFHVGGTIANPELTGRFEAFEGGEMRFRDVRYVVDRAIVDFPSGPVFNPEFDINAETRVGDYDVRAHLSGNFDHLDYELSSTPPLSEKQLLALLLTGSAPSEQELAGNAELGTPASIVSGQIGSLVGGRLEHWLGFEEIRIESVLTQGSSTDPTTRVALGKRISPRLFVRSAIALNSPEDPLYQVEYSVTRRLRLVAERGDLGALGGTVRYSTQLRSPFARRRGAGSAASASTGGSSKRKRRVANITFTGDPNANVAELLGIVDLQTGGEFSRRKMIESADKIKKRYVKDSYLEASIRAVARLADDANMNVTFEIEKGPKVRVAIEGAGSLQRRIRRELESLWLESTFSGDLPTEAESHIRKLLQDEGYYACYVAVRTKTEGDTDVITVHVDAGEKVAVEDVQIVGASSIPEPQLREQILTGNLAIFRREPLKPSVLAADVAAVEGLYHSRGYLQAQVRSSVSLTLDGRRATVTITVIEGPLSHLRSVTITGTKQVPLPEIRALVASREGQAFLPETVISDTQAIQQFYDSHGFPEAKVDQQIFPEGDQIDLTYKITEGEPKTVEQVVIDGNALTKDSVIRESVTWKTGDPLSASKIRETRQKLMKTGLFTDVQVVYEDAPGEGTGQIVRVHVAEAKSLVLSVGAGYDTENGARTSLDVFNTNLWGRGKFAGISALYGSKVTHVQATYKEPRLLGSGWSASLTNFYDQRVRESFSERQTGLSLLFQHKTAGHLTHYLRYGIGRSEIYDLLIDLAQFREENPKLDPTAPLRLASAGYAILRDTRNDPLNATKGSYASADVRGFTKDIGSEARLAKTYLQGSYYHGLPLGFQWVGSARIGIAWRGEGFPIPIQERYFAGGDSTVRGFQQDKLGFVETIREKEVSRDLNGDGTICDCKVTLDDGTLEHDTLRPFGGESVVILNTELRHPIYKNFSAVAFADMGNTYRRATDVFNGKLRYTAGLGVRVETPVGPLRLEYGRKIDRLPGESAGEYVLSIGQSF